MISYLPWNTFFQIVKVDFDDVCQLVPKHEEDYD